METYDNIGANFNDDPVEDAYAMPTNIQNQAHPRQKQSGTTSAIQNDTLTKTENRHRGGVEINEKQEQKNDYVYAQPMKRVRGAKQKSDSDAKQGIDKNNSFLKGETETESLVDPHLYISHQQMVGQEVTRIKMDRKVNNDKAKANQGTGNENNDTGSSIHNKKDKHKREVNPDGNNNSRPRSKYGESHEQSPVKREQHTEGMFQTSNDKTNTDTSLPTSSTSLPFEDDNRGKTNKIKKTAQEAYCDHQKRGHYLKRTSSKRDYYKNLNGEKLKKTENSSTNKVQDIKLTPEEDQMFEALGISHSSKNKKDFTTDHSSQKELQRQSSPRGVSDSDSNTNNTIANNNNSMDFDNETSQIDDLDRASSQNVSDNDQTLYTEV